jgi:hypothetical protein
MECGAGGAAFIPIHDKGKAAPEAPHSKKRSNSIAVPRSDDDSSET